MGNFRFNLARKRWMAIQHRSGLYSERPASDPNNGSFSHRSIGLDSPQLERFFRHWSMLKQEALLWAAQRSIQNGTGGSLPNFSARLTAQLILGVILLLALGPALGWMLWYFSDKAKTFIPNIGYQQGISVAKKFDLKFTQWSALSESFIDLKRPNVSMITDLRYPAWDGFQKFLLSDNQYLFDDPKGLDSGQNQLVTTKNQPQLSKESQPIEVNQPTLFVTSTRKTDEDDTIKTSGLKAPSGLWRVQAQTDQVSVSAQLKSYLESLGVRIGAQKPLAWEKKPGLFYYHFILPKDKEQKVLEFLKQNLRIQLMNKELSPRPLAVDEIRFIVELQVNSSL